MAYNLILRYAILLLLLSMACNDNKQNNSSEGNPSKSIVYTVDDPSFDRKTGVFKADKYTGALWHFDTLTQGILEGHSGLEENYGDVHSVQLVNTGRFAKAYKFDGTSSFIRIDHSKYTSPKHAITVEFWAYIEKDQHGVGFPTFLSKDSTYEGSGQASYEFYINNVASDEYGYNIVWRINTDAGEFALPADNTEWNWRQHLANQKWHYYAMTYDGQEMRIYIDGKLKNKREIKKSLLSQTKNPLRISRKYGETGNFFNGMMDELRISNVARSEKAISTYWNAVQGK